VAFGLRRRAPPQGEPQLTGLDDARIVTKRLTLEPLRAEDADEMVEVLVDERLYGFVGGPLTSRDEVRARYRQLAAGSGKPEEVWLNWIARRRSDSRPVGTMRATLRSAGDGWTAEIAWLIGVPWQDRGLASEAAVALVEWLRRHGIEDIRANIHPEHAASATVAARAGLEPTDDEVDGERIWRAASPRSPPTSAV
jgi:RimJ/RimL family protein N-acetyltransferase